MMQKIGADFSARAPPYHGRDLQLQYYKKHMIYRYLGGGFKYFLSSPLCGEESQFD